MMDLDTPRSTTGESDDFKVGTITFFRTSISEIRGRVKIEYGSVIEGTMAIVGVGIWWLYGWKFICDAHRRNWIAGSVHQHNTRTYVIASILIFFHLGPVHTHLFQYQFGPRAPRDHQLQIGNHTWRSSARAGHVWVEDVLYTGM